MGLGLLICKLRVSAVTGEPLGSAIRSWPTAIRSLLSARATEHLSISWRGGPLLFRPKSPYN